MARLNQKLSIFEGEEKTILGKRVHREFENILENFDDNGRLIAYKEAIRHGARYMTFGELNTEANLTARILRQRIDSENVQGIKDDVLGIYINPSIERLIAILAVIKLGATFLPLNPNLPDNRIKYMLEKSKATGLLALNKEHVEHLNSVFADTTCIVLDYNALRCKAVDAGLSRDNLSEDEEFPGDKNSSAVLSIVFTSGTTGKPKGVSITHRGVLNMTMWQENEFSMGSEERNSHQVNCLAVSFNCETFGSLLRGKPLVVISEETRANPEEFIRVLQSNKINRVLGCSPTLAQNMFLILNDQGRTESLQSLRALQVGGEIVPPGLILDYLALHNFKDGNIINGYGMTETTMLCLVESFRSRQDTIDKIRDGKAAIGSPIPNNNVYILNDQLEPVRHGEVGQICVSGVNVSAGYLSDHLNSDMFHPNHILQQPGHEVLLCTGDYGAIHNGLVYYEGRKQSRLKIRGYRVSTIEVEETIMQVAGVKRAAAFGHGESDGDTIIAAYYTCVSGVIVATEEILAHCQRELPEHSIPRLYRLEELPLRPPIYKVDYPALRLLFSRRNENADGAAISSSPAKTAFIFKNVKNMSEKEKQLAVKLVADSYLGTDSRIIKCLELTRDFYEEYTAMALPMAAKDSMSFCVIDSSSNKMVALALVLDNNPDVQHVEVTDQMSNEDASVSQFLLDLEGPYMIKDELLPGKTAWANRFGIDPTLQQAQILQITTMCIEQSIKRARDIGFSRFHLSSPHQSIQEMMFRLGATINHQIQMSTYESRGFRPFANVPADVFICSMVLELKRENVGSKRRLTLQDLINVISNTLFMPPHDIDADKNLFQIGANSINAVKIWAQLKDLGYSSRFEDFLAAPTIAEILHLERQVGCHKQDGIQYLSAISEDDTMAVIAEVLSLPNDEVVRNRDKSFFEMGGNSGNAARAWSTLRALGHQCTFGEFISATSINDIIAKTKQERGSTDTDANDSFVIIPMRDLSEESIDQTLECIVDSYNMNKNEILKVLHNFPAETFKYWVDHAWVQAKQDGMSFAIRKKLSNKIVAGGFLTSKSRWIQDDSETETINDTALEPEVVGILNVCEGPFLKLEPSLPGKTLWTSCFGIHPDIRGRHVIDIMCIAINYSIRVGRQRGFKRLYAFTANPTFQTLLMERGARIYTRVQIATFEQDGRKPFGDAPSDAYNMTIVLEL